MQKTIPYLKTTTKDQTMKCFTTVLTILLLTGASTAMAQTTPPVDLSAGGHINQAQLEQAVTRIAGAKTEVMMTEAAKTAEEGKLAAAKEALAGLQTKRELLQKAIDETLPGHVEKLTEATTTLSTARSQLLTAQTSGNAAVIQAATDALEAADNALKTARGAFETFVEETNAATGSAVTKTVDHLLATIKFNQALTSLDEQIAEAQAAEATAETAVSKATAAYEEALTEQKNAELELQRIVSAFAPQALSAQIQEQAGQPVTLPTEITTQLAEILKQVQTNGSNTAALQTQITALSEKVVQVQGELTALREEHTAAAAATAQTLGEVKTEVLATRRELGEFRTEVKTELGKLSGLMTANSQAITALSEQISAIPLPASKADIAAEVMNRLEARLSMVATQATVQEIETLLIAMKNKLEASSTPAPSTPTTTTEPTPPTVRRYRLVWDCHRGCWMKQYVN